LGRAERVLEAQRWAGAVALCAMPTHDDETVMNGAPASVVGYVDGRGRSRYTRDAHSCAKSAHEWGTRFCGSCADGEGLCVVGE
jgi:hypothetical protein